MIFKPITKINTKTEKDFCIELIRIYQRLVEVYCQKNNIAMSPQADDKETIKE